MPDPWFADLSPAQRYQIRDAHAHAKEHPMAKDLTLDNVRQRADKIVEMDRGDQGDPEAAHGDQDELYEDVLRAVATGHPDARAMATECLRVAESGGTRWYA